MKTSYILGVSCYYHDSAAAIIQDGQILAAVQEERFTRKKHDACFPTNSIRWMLEKQQISSDQIEAIVYYEKPFITFERLIETNLFHAPFGFKNFMLSIPLWIKEKLFVEKTMKRKLNELGLGQIPIKFSEHHLSHAASAFYASPFEEALILCVDGVGEWATTSVWKGQGHSITPIKEIHFPHSLGLFYSAYTAYLGFKVNSGEYKVMGLAPYGSPVYLEKILQTIQLNDDGSYSLNMKFFDYGRRPKMFSRELELLLGRESRTPEGQLDQFHMDVAASLQKALEVSLLHLTKGLQDQYGGNSLCLAGGVALNCVANSKILNASGFKDFWIQPAAGDAGGALGAALAYWHIQKKQPRHVSSPDLQKGSLLGPEFSSKQITDFLDLHKVPYSRLEAKELLDQVCQGMEEGKIIGWFQGAMEFGPRALGARSILGDARIPDLQKKMNLKIKYRESFRPFAPIVLQDDVASYFDWHDTSPYMLFTAPVKNEHLIATDPADDKKFGIDKLNVIRSQYPAITHIDHSARLQTVDQSRNPKLHGLLSRFKERNQTSVLVNTSFNVRGEPIVCTPEDAYRCFRRTEIDVLVMEDILIVRKDLPEFKDSEWRNDFELD